MQHDSADSSSCTVLEQGDWLMWLVKVCQPFPQQMLSLSAMQMYHHAVALAQQPRQGTCALTSLLATATRYTGPQDSCRG